MLITRKPEALRAIQFTGDPSIHPMIWWCPEERLQDAKVIPGHWRFGGESHGGRYGDGSSRLEHGSYIVSSVSRSWVMSEDELNKQWDIVVTNISDRVIDLKHTISAVNPATGRRYDENNAVLFPVEDKAILMGLRAYYEESIRLGSSQSDLDSISKLIERVEIYQKETAVK